MKKSVIKYLALGIGGLLGLSFISGASLSNQFASKEESINTALASYEGDKLPTGGGELASGTYYLDGDMTLTNYITVASGKDVVINLNGYSLRANSNQNIAYVNGGTLTINGKNDVSGDMGTLCNGSGYHDGSYTRGGAIAIYNGGEVTVNDCNIRDNECNFAGAIFVSAGTTATLNNCNVYNNVTNNPYGYRGVIYVEGISAKAYINGGEIYGNSAGVYLFEGTANRSPYAKLNGVYIHDNLQYGVGIEHNENGNPSLTIAGDTIIKNNSTQVTSGARTNLRINNNNDAKIAIDSELGLGDNAYIGITLQGDKTGSKAVFTNSANTSYNDASKFFSDDSNYSIIKNGDGQLTLGVAVATITVGSDISYYDSFASALTNWVEGSTLTLLKDVTISENIPITFKRTLDLNGFGIRQTGDTNIFDIADLDSDTNRDLTIIDSNPTRPHAITLSNYRGTAVSNDTGTTNVTNGTGTAYITGGYLTGGNSSNEGGAIRIFNRYSKVNITGGTFIGNIGTYGGAISLYSNSVSLSDITVIYNKATNGSGGIHNNGSTVTISDSNIQYNIGTVYTGGIYSGWDTNHVSIQGNTIINNNYLGTTLNNLNVDTDGYVKVSGELGEDAYIGITAGSDSKVVTNSDNTSFNDASKFHADKASLSIIKASDGQLKLSDIVATVTSGTTVTEYNNFNDAITALNSASEGATLTLLNDVTTSATLSITNVCNLDLNGFGIKATGTDYSVLTIDNGGNLTIIDSGDSLHYFTISDVQANGAGFATICNEAAYNVAAENARGTFQGGYITGGNITSTGLYQYTAGAITVKEGGELDFKDGTIIGNNGGTESPGGVSSFGTFKLNGGNIIYNRGRRGSGVFLDGGTFVMNSGSIEYNTGVGANEYGTAAVHSYGSTESISLNGGSISHNYAKYGGIVTPVNIFLSGDFVAVDNVACGSSGTEAANGNIVLTEGSFISGCITGNTPIGISFISGSSGVFTNNTDTSLNDPSKFVSDNPNYTIGVYPAGHTTAGQLFIGNKVTVTYTTERGIAPISDTVANGSIIYNEPTSPSQEGYDFKGWYKEAECENVWDFDNDVVTSDITLYAKWDYDEATANVIKLINDIGTLTYDGGSNDSLDDILAAKTAYDTLSEVRKDIVNGVNKDILDHDVTTYRNVDKVGDLIKAIPEPNPTKEYYDAIDLAKTEYDKLTTEEVTILNTTIDFEQFLNDNIAARKVIIEIEEIGEVTYDGGIDDSKKDIEKAEKSYDELTKDQKDIVDYVNHDVLVDDREIYDQLDKAIKAIKDIGKVDSGDTTKEKLDEARDAYDVLPDELKEFVKDYDNSLKVLEDDEKVYEALVLIDEIGEVGYDSASQEKIQKARTYYDSLSDDQKELIAPEVLRALEEKESAYDTLSNKGNTTLLVLYIIFGILLLVGIIYFFFLVRKKKNNDDNDSGSNNGNEGAVRLASFTGLTPFIIYASHYLDAGYILLYVIIALTVIVWVTDLAILVYKKTHKNEKVIEEAKQVETTKLEEAKPQFEKEPEPVNEDEEEVVTITDEKGNIFNIRYIKSFTAKLIQSPEETKKYYEELKNYVLSYKKTTSRISWHYDSINSSRNQVLKFAIRGKTLCLYYPLNVEDYNDTKYKVEAVDSKKFEEVPCLYRIKNDRRLGYAKDLIDTVMANLGLVKGEEQHEVYSDLPYEPNKHLISRGLIKELKVQVNKPVEQVVSKKVNDDGDEIVTTRDNKGNIFEIRYIKSFTAKLSQVSEEVKDYYNELKNYALSYKKANSRISWHFDSINVGRNQVIKFSIRGKTLCVYYALNANDYLDTKYKVEAVDSKKFEEVPCLYRIKNDRRRDYAKDLIDTVMANVPTIKGKESNEDFRIPYESTKALLAKGLIKENKVQVNKPVEDKPVEQMSEDEEEVITITDEKGNIFNIRYIKSFTAKLIQSPEETKKYYEELKNYVLSYKKTTSRISWHYDSINSGRNQVIKFSIRGKTLCVYYALDANDYLDTKYKVEAVDSKKFEEVPCLYRIKNDRRLGYAKDLIDTVMNNLGLVKGEEQHEVYSDLPYEENKPLIARGLIKELKVQVNKPVAPVVIKAEEVDVKMSDEEATSQIKEDSGSKKHVGKKGIVNIDVIAKSFRNNEVVNIESLWEKKIISKNIGHVKVLARGSLNKKLNFELQDYSLQAVKMILLTGGTVKRVK